MAPILALPILLCENPHSICNLNPASVCIKFQKHFPSSLVLIIDRSLNKLTGAAEGFEMISEIPIPENLKC
jgi:hypothetical protein